MFAGSAFNQPLRWNVTKVFSVAGMFGLPRELGGHGVTRAMSACNKAQVQSTFMAHPTSAHAWEHFSMLAGADDVPGYDWTAEADSCSASPQPPLHLLPLLGALLLVPAVLWVWRRRSRRKRQHATAAVAMVDSMPFLRGRAQLANDPDPARAVAPQPSAPAPHREILGSDILLDRVLGEGGNGVVHFGKWLGVSVAVKMLRRAGDELTPAAARELEREASALSELRHPCVCTFFGMATIGSRRALIMEYYSGGGLDAFLYGGSASPVPQGSASSTPPTGTGSSIVAGYSPRRHIDTCVLQRIARETASGIAFLHASRYLHRDIKPANVLLTEGFSAKVADFGVAKLSLPDEEQTRDCGTARYQAPEVRSGGQYDEKCDVFSFGVLLWELLHVRKVMDDRDASSARIAHCSGERAAINLPDDRRPYDSLITACWTQSADSRPPMSIVVTAMVELEGKTRAGLSHHGAPRDGERATSRSASHYTSKLGGDGVILEEVTLDSLHLSSVDR